MMGYSISTFNLQPLPGWKQRLYKEARAGVAVAAVCSVAAVPVPEISDEDRGTGDEATTGARGQPAPWKRCAPT